MGTHLQSLKSNLQKMSKTQTLTLTRTLPGIGKLPRKRSSAERACHDEPDDSDPGTSASHRKKLDKRTVLICNIPGSITTLGPLADSAVSYGKIESMAWVTTHASRHHLGTTNRARVTYVEASSAFNLISANKEETDSFSRDGLKCLGFYRFEAEWYVDLKEVLGWQHYQLENKLKNKLGLSKLTRKQKNKLVNQLSKKDSEISKLRKENKKLKLEIKTDDSTLREIKKMVKSKK